MSVVLGEWELTTDTAKLKIENLSMRDLEAEVLNLYCEKM